MQLIFVTGNETKVLHAQKALEDLDIEVVQKKLSLDEPREEDPEEVVLIKARQAMREFREPLIVEDSGVFITALNGFPKTYVHFALDTIGIKGIIKLLTGEKNRSAEFRQSLAFMSPDMKEPQVFSYTDGGYSVSEKIWTSESEVSAEFDRILIPPGEDKPLCMFSKAWRARRDTEKNPETIHYRQLARYLSQKQVV
jgi:XTP/dITP diphosphohydrolase